MKIRILRKIILFSSLVINCLKVQRSPFDMSSSNSGGLGFIIAIASTPTQLIGYFVSLNGNDANEGNSALVPKRTIQSAISAAIPPTKIYIAAGNYDLNSGTGNHIILVEGVSLYGGYPQDFTSRDITNNVTSVTDIASSTVIQNSQTIYAGSSITSATVVDGLTINASSNENATNTSAIFCQGGSPTISSNIIKAGNLNGGATVIAIFNFTASPVISGNSIYGGSSQSSSTFGIFNLSGSSPRIENNYIYGGAAPMASSHGIYNAPQANNPTITGNTMQGGSGNLSYAINTSSPSDSTVINNSLDGGTGTITAYAIYHNYSAGSIINLGNYQSNSLFTSGGGTRYCFYENAGLSSSSPLVFNNNRLYSCPQGLYIDEGSTSRTLAEINGGLTTNEMNYTGNYQ